MENSTSSSNLFITTSSEKTIPFHISTSETSESKKTESMVNIIEDMSSLKCSFLSSQSKKKLKNLDIKKNQIPETQQHSSEKIEESISFDKTPSRNKIIIESSGSSNISPNLFQLPPRDYSPGGERSLKLLNNIMERMSAKKFSKTPARTPQTEKNAEEIDKENIISSINTPISSRIPRISGVSYLKTAISSSQIIPNCKESPTKLIGRSYSTPNFSKSYASTTSETSALPISNELSNECLENSQVIISDDDDEDDESLAPTQICSQSGIFKNIIAYVEVRFGADNRSWGVKGTLEDLGATVVPKFNKNVTHVVFHEGLLSTYKKAKKRKVHIVSVLWIEECKKARKLVSESLYPPLDTYRYEHAELFKSIPRVKSIQPDFDNEQPLKLTRKKLKIFNEMKEKLRKEREELEKIKHQIETENKNRVSPNQRRLETFKLLLNPEDHYLLTEPTTENNSQNSDDVVTTPLAVRLWRKFNTPKVTPLSAYKLKATDNENEVENNFPKSSNDLIIPTRNRVRNNLFPTDVNPNKSLSNNEDDSQENYIPNSDFNKVQVINSSNDSEHFSSKMENITDFGNEDLSLTNCSKDKTTYLSAAFKRGRTVKKRKLFTPTNLLSFEDLGSPPPSPSPLKTRIDALIKTTQKLEIGPASKRQCKNKRINKVNKFTEVTTKNKSTKRNLFQTKNSTGSSDSRPSSDFFVSRKENSSSRSTRSSSYLFQSDDFRNLRSTTRNSIVCTSLHREENILVNELVNSLGGFTIEETVSSRTSHVICGQPRRRTINLLKGIARGCWIVTLGWVLESKQQNRWVDETDYELQDFSHAVRQCRLERLAFGPTFRLHLFESCGRIFVSPKCSPKRQDINELITLGGGILTKTSRNANIIVGHYPNSKKGIIIVLEKWVLDSIMLNQVQDLKDYILP